MGALSLISQKAYGTAPAENRTVLRKIKFRDLRFIPEGFKEDFLHSVGHAPFFGGVDYRYFYFITSLIRMPLILWSDLL